jgi:predicted lipid carrier protein YhbT
LRILPERVEHRNLLASDRSVVHAILALVATRAQVERTLADLIKRLHATDVTDLPMPEQRTLVCHIRDLDLYYTGDWVGGRIASMTAQTAVPRADVMIGVSSDDLVALGDGRLSPVYAFLSGKLRVEAHARDMMLIRQLF